MGFSLKKLGSRIYDQVNMFDNNRTYKQRTPTQTKSVFQQAGQAGGQFTRGTVGGLAKMANTAAVQAPQVVDTLRQSVAAQTGNTSAFQAATERLKATESRFNRNRGGFLNVGTLYDTKEAQRGDLKTGAKRIGGGTLQGMAEAYTLGVGAPVGASVKQFGVKEGLRRVTPALGKTLAGNVFQGGITTANQGGTRNDIIKSALLSGALGTVGDVGLGVAGAAVKPVVTGTAGKVYNSAKPKVGLKSLDQSGAIKNPFKRGPSDAELGIPKPLKSNQVIKDTAKLTALNEYRQMLTAPDNVTAGTINRVVGKVHALNKEHNLDLLTGSPADKLRKVTQFLENNGEAINNPPKRGFLGQKGGNSPDNSPTIRNIFGEDVPNPSYDPKVSIRMQKDYIEAMPPKAGSALSGEGAKLPPKAGTTVTSVDPVTKKITVKKLGESGRISADPNESEVISALKNIKGKKTSSINTERLDLTPEQKILAKADTTTDIGTLSNKEVLRLADYAGIDSKKVGLAETKKTITEQLNLRRKMVETHRLIDESLASGDIEGRAALLKQAAEEGSISVSQGADIARQLQARKIMANELNTPWQKVSKLLNEADVDPDVYSKRFAGVDLKDANEVARAYRELVPAKFGDWIEKYRYTNMLSSPLTHIVNATSNLTGSTVIAPIQKLYEGAVDATRAGVTGKARTRFAGEAGASLGATFRSLPDAMKAFGDVMTGKGDITNPDFAQSLKGSRLAVGGFKGGVDATLEFIPKLLEAADKFTMTMTNAGETAGLKYRVKKGVKVKDIVGTAEEAAKYRAFRQELGKQGQGHVLEAIDFIPQMFMRAKTNKNPLISWPARIVLPFVTTPTNLFKQGLEYSPLGITTLAGNTNKTAQVAKMLMGTTAIASVGATAAANDGLTFNEPTSAAERDAFRAEGKQPYAIKIGGKWIGYSKLHPAISFNLALTAAVKDGLDKGTIDESGADKIMRIGGGMMGYFTDQSYMKSVGDAVNIFKGGDGASIGDAISAQGTNMANQAVPFKSMVSWIGRMVDPTQRKVDYTANPMEQIYQGVIKDIPGLNKDVPARKNPYTGENLTNDNPILNSFVPTRVTNDRGYGNTTGLNVEQRMAQKDMPAGDREAFRSEIMYQKGVENLSTNEKEKFKLQEGKGVKQLPNGKFFTKVGKEYKTFDNQADAEVAIFKEDFKKSNKKSAINGDTYYYKNKAGKVITKPKIQYEYEQVEAQSNLDMDRALAKKDLNSWFAAADKKYAALEAKKGLYDPETEQDEINKIILQQENLREKADKYGAYGGFTKGSSGGGGGGSTASSYYGKTKSSVKGKVATPSVGGGRAPVKLKGSVKYTAAGKPKVTIRKSMV